MPIVPSHSPPTEVSRATRFIPLWLLLLLTVPAAWAYPDEPFYQALAENGIAEVDAAHLALQKSSNAMVKDFATMMVTDHTLVNDRLKALAGSRRFRLPSSANATAQTVQSKLALLSGRTFDRFYIRDQICVHEEMLDLINKEISSGKDARAQAFAQEILATVQTHLKLIRVLAASEGV